MNELVGIRNKQTGYIACPLKSVAVKARLDAHQAEVAVTQHYVNDGAHNIEALYVFPIPTDAQVTGFHATIGNKQIQSEFREKQEAQRQYQEVIRRGDTGLLLEHQDSNQFQFSIGNLLAGEQASITITYIQTLTLIDQELRWMLQTVIAPRYKPSDKVIAPPRGGATYPLQLEVTLSASAGVKKVSSPSHPIEMSLERGDWKINLSREDYGLDRDFVLIALLEDEHESSLITAGNGEFDAISYAQIHVIPDWSYKGTQQQPVEYTFLIDISGSMAGGNLTQAKRAVAIALRNMAENSFFQLIAFESDAHFFATEPVRYSQQQLAKADQWINELDAMGGTEIYDPLYGVLEQKRQNTSREHIILLFTDGAVGNEQQVIQLVKKHQDRIRLFPFGIDTAVNTSFIEGLAEHGNGVPEYVHPGERIEDKVTRQFARIHQHALEQPEFVDAKGDPLNVVPALPERLYYADSYKFWVRGSNVQHVELRGILNGQPQHLAIRHVGKGDVRLLKLAWAKATIAQLEEALESTNHVREREHIYQQLVDLSTKYGILSSATALFAIHRNEGKQGTQMPETIVVPLAMPARWNTNELEMANFEIGQHVKLNHAVHEQFDNMLVKADRMMEAPSMSVQRSRQQRPRQEATLADRAVSAVQEAIWSAAQKQQADGQFGSGANREAHTAMFIIAMLMLSKHWKTYRVQIMKAAECLLRNSNNGSLTVLSVPARLLTFIAYERLREMKVIPDAMISTLEQQTTKLKSQLTNVELKAVEHMQRGDHQHWLKLAGITGIKSTQPKSTEIATALLNQIADGK
jgi:Ca-activated chloride channel family protein